MLTILYSLLAFIVATSILIAVHEFGHFFVARSLGVKVLRFSLGFGKPLIAWHDRLGTEYVVAAIPLGGYVKMLDQNEGAVAQNERHRAFNNKPIWIRMLVIAAGPAFNLLFAFIAYCLVYLWGIAAIVPVLGDIPKGSAAYVAGLHSGQEVLAVGEQPTRTWEDVAVALMSNIGDRSFINIKVQDQTSKEISVHALKLTNWTVDNNNDENTLKDLGLDPIDPVAPIVGKVVPDLPAAKIGLEPGDRIVRLDGETVDSRSKLMNLLRDKYDQPVSLEIIREHEHLHKTIIPMKKLLDGGSAIGFIGIQFADQPWPANLVRTQRYGLFQAIPQAFERTLEYTELTLHFLYKMVAGKLSLQNVAGPISIAQFAGRTAVSGPEYFLSFLALISISLGVLNMLPIPILDGGHFMFCIVEAIRGKALSQRAMNFCNSIGFALLGGFMVLAMYNDVLRLLH